MTINDLGAIGDFFGGLAVIAGLVFVGLQLRTANREARISANQMFADSIIGMGKIIYESDEMSDIWIRGLTGLDCLKPNERVRFMGVVSNNMLRKWENLHSQKVNKRLDKSVWISAEQTLRPLLNTKGFTDVWALRKPWYRPSFQSYIEKLVAQAVGPNLLEIYETIDEAESDT